MLNLIKMAVLSCALVMIASFLGRLVFDESGKLCGALVGVMGCILIYNSAEQFILNVFKPKLVDITAFPVLYQVVSEVSSKMGISMPNVYVLEAPQPNVFTVGVYPSVGSIVVTSGLLTTLNRCELAMAIAHECAHILNRDIFSTTIIAYVAGGLTECAEYIKVFSASEPNKKSIMSQSKRYSGIYYILGLLLSFLAAICVQAFVSRSDDWAADEQAVNVIKDPKALISALGKIQKAVEKHSSVLAEKYPATFAMFLVSPSKSDDFIGELFVTQLRTAERIRRLEQMQNNS